MENRTNTVDGSCALTAAQDALGGDKHDSYGPFLAAIYGDLMKTQVTCPVCTITMCLDEAIGCHLNDKHKKTREWIAD